MPCAGSTRDVLESYWSALDTEYRVSLAVKAIPVSGGRSRILIRNRFADQ
jgi:hypothetical protein